MRVSARGAFLIVMLLPTVLPAFAQDATDDAPLTPEESAMLANALVFDPAALAAPPKKPLRVPGEGNGEYNITRTQKPDGSTSIEARQPLQSDWSNSVGADLVATKPSPLHLPLPTEQNDGLPAGAAWASIGLRNLASVDARIDPANERGKVGTTIKHTMPFGSRFAVTVQDTYSVTETLGQQPAPGPGGLPLMSLPAAGGTPATSQVFGNEKAVKFNILPTGTTLGAGLATTSNDPVTHNTFSAQQKLYGPLNVTTSVSDVGQPTTNKKVTAGFKLNW